MSVKPKITEFYAWIGADDLPVVSTVLGRIDTPELTRQLKSMARQYGKPIHLCRFTPARGREDPGAEMTHITRGYSDRSQEVYCGLTHHDLGWFARLLTESEARTRATRDGNTWQQPDLCQDCVGVLIAKESSRGSYSRKNAGASIEDERK